MGPGSPVLGMIVLAFCDPAANNGSDVCPAIVTRVLNDTMINLRLVPDSDAPMRSAPSVHLYTDEETARAANDGKSFASGAFWPPA